MVRVSGCYKDRPENISTRRRKEGWKSPVSVPKAGKVAPDMENSNLEVDPEMLGNLKNQNFQESTAPHDKSAPNFQDHGNKGDLFSQQL